MPFNPNIPAPSDNLDDSQGDLLANNQSLDASFTMDHTLFSDATADNGLHKKVTFYQVAADPEQTFPASMLYSKNSGTNPNQLTDLWFSFKPQTGADQAVKLAGIVTTSSANAGTAGGTIYKTVTPWGLTIYSGQTISLSSGTGKTVTFPTPLTTIYGSGGWANTGSSAITVSCLQSVSDLTIYVGNVASVNWFVIGAT